MTEINEWKYIRPVQSQLYCDGLDMIKTLNQIIGIKFVVVNSFVCVCVRVALNKIVFTSYLPYNFHHKMVRTFISSNKLEFITHRLFVFVIFMVEFY